MGDWKESRGKGLSHIKEHLPRCCSEILEWHSKAILPDGEVRLAAAMMMESGDIDYATALSLAESACNQFSMEFVISKTVWR